jgi:hypothetical protein
MNQLTPSSQKYLLDSKIVAVGESSIIIGGIVVVLNVAQIAIINMAVRERIRNGKAKPDGSDHTRGHSTAHIEEEA